MSIEKKRKISNYKVSSMKYLLVIFIFFVYIINFQLGSLSKDISQTQEGAEWSKINDYDYIDLDSINGTENYYGFNFNLKSFNRGQYEKINNTVVSYTITKYSINCLKQKYNITKIDCYDNNDNFISEELNPYSRFRPIISGTSIKNVFNNLCRI